jgi:outer membrane protein OmpA-like peptidoglycan-associated protein
LNKIYYDFDKWDILPEAEIDLNIIKDLMDQYPDMVIELSSHTDIRGPARYNQNLSQQRAQSAKDWLVQRGIVENRIQAVGYGEERIANQCKQGTRCSEEDHRFNRRTEFKIIEGPTEIQITKEILKGATRQGE